MIDKELEVVDDLGDSQISEKFSMAIDSSILQNQNGRSQGAQELQKRLKNLRSIKLSKSPSLKSSRRRARQRSNNHHVCSDAASSAAQSISSDLSTCSETSTENLQASILNSQPSVLFLCFAENSRKLKIALFAFFGFYVEFNKNNNKAV